MMNENSTVSTQPQVIALVHCDPQVVEQLKSCDFGEKQILLFNNGLELASKWESGKLNVAAVIAQGEVLSPTGISLLKALISKNLGTVPFFLVSQNINRDLRRLALDAGVIDVFKLPLKIHNVESRVNFMIEHWIEFKTKLDEKPNDSYTIPLDKRIFDIVFSGLALLCLSPLFLIIYLLIKLESKGPAFYYSLRVGTGYRVFKFYKFRSMYVNADKRLKDLKHLNQYTNANEPVEVKNSVTGITVLLCNDCRSSGKCQFPIYADNNSWCEKAYMTNKKSNGGSAFFKLKNDPRITKIGGFIRNTSIDELPQLWNVFIGDMSIVGNRPLPLYEAEKLTTDKYALRFHAPAGITGLWQVEKRGKGEMSEEERLMLDNTYAKNHSLRYDMKLILKTIPALLQKENV